MKRNTRKNMEVLFLEKVMPFSSNVRAIRVSELSLHAAMDSAESNNEIMMVLLGIFFVCDALLSMHILVTLSHFS